MCKDFHMTKLSCLDEAFQDLFRFGRARNVTLQPILSLSTSDRVRKLFRIKVGRFFQATQKTPWSHTDVDFLSQGIGIFLRISYFCIILGGIVLHALFAECKVDLCPTVTNI